MRRPPKLWTDLAALLDPARRCAGPAVSGSHPDWYALYALAAGQLVAPLLLARLLENDCLHLVPEDVRDALEVVHDLNAAHNDRMRAILRDTVRLLNAQGIEPLLLKGSICLLPGQAPGGSTRMIGDIDLALVNAAPEWGEEALLAGGYWHAPDQGPFDYRESHHLAPLFHPGGEGYVEIHREICSPRVPAGVLPLAKVSARAERLHWDGLRVCIPSRADRILHNALHHQFQDTPPLLPSRCAMRQLHEFVQLRALTAGPDVDWPETLSALQAHGLDEKLRAYLLLAEHLFAQPLPSGVEVTQGSLHHLHRMWWWMSHPRLLRLALFAVRLPNLPKRLFDPGWYPKTYRRIRRQRVERMA